MIRYCPAKRNQIISNIFNIVSDGEDLPELFLKDLVAPLMYNLLVKDVCHTHIVPGFKVLPESMTKPGFGAVIGTCEKILTSAKIKQLTSKFPKLKDSTVDWESWRAVKLANWNVKKKQNYLHKMVEDWTGGPMMFVIKISQVSCMIIFSFSEGNKNKVNSQNISIPHHDNDFIIYSRDNKATYFYKLTPTHADNSNSDDSLIVFNMLADYESIIFMDKKLAKISMPSN